MEDSIKFDCMVGTSSFRDKLFSSVTSPSSCNGVTNLVSFDLERFNELDISWRVTPVIRAMTHIHQEILGINNHFAAIFLLIMELISLMLPL